MNNIFSKLGLESRYEKVFDELCCNLESFSEGMKFINQDASFDDVAVTEQLMSNFQELEYSIEETDRLLYVFNIIKFYFVKKLKITNDVEFKYQVAQEKNQLADLVGHEKVSSIDAVLKKVYTAEISKLKDRQLFGLLSLLLAIECGVFSIRNQISLIEALIDSKSVNRIEGLYFVDFMHKDSVSGRFYSKRVFLGSLTLSLLLRFNLINDLPNIVGKSYLFRLIKSCRLSFLNADINKSIDSSFTNHVLSKDLKFFSLYYLPGFLQQVAYGFQDSFSLSLQDFAKLHGVYIPSQEIEAKAIDDDDDDDDDDEKSNENTKPRFIKCKYFSESDLNKLIDYLSIHPTVSHEEFLQFEYILNLCFYLGLRRSEALYLRNCDVFTDETASAPASIYIRKYIGRSIKSDSARRLQPINLLPNTFSIGMTQNIDHLDPNLLIGRMFSKMQAIHFFDRLSKLMQECLGSKFSLHICRHSYISRGILLSEFSALNLNKLAPCSTFIREIERDHVSFRASFRLPDITRQHLTNLSQSAGHATVKTTLRHYCHSTDLLIYGALNSQRPEGYSVAISHYSKICERSLKRWKAEGLLEAKVMEQLSRSSPHVCHYTTPLMPITPLIKQSYTLYKQSNIAGELSSRELKEWERLYTILHAADREGLVRFFYERLVSRGAFKIRTKAELKHFRQLIKCRTGLVACCWEVSQPRTGLSSYAPLSANNDYSFPLLLRIDYSGDESMGNAPRRIFPMLIRALISRNI